jgi:hypothetical protein
MIKEEETGGKSQTGNNKGNDSVFPKSIGHQFEDYNAHT